jgi:membrane fusion protein
VGLPQPVSNRLLTWALVLTVAVGLLYLSAAQFSRKQTVAGYLRPASGTLKVYPTRPGTITAVYVRQGEAVRQGQKLFSVATPQFAANGEDVDAAKLAALQREQASLRDQIAAEQQRARSEQARLNATIDGDQAEIAGLRQQIQIQRQRITLAQGLVRTADWLLAQGDMALFVAKQREDTLLQQQQTLASLQKQLSDKQNELIGARYSLAELPPATAGKVQVLRDRTAEVEGRIADIHAQQAYVMRAPAAGRVTALQATAGQSVDPQHLQLEIVPQGAPLQAVLFIPTRAAGFVHVGQEVRFLYDAFPYQNFGTHRGHIVAISHTVLTRADVTGPMQPRDPSYEAVAALDRTDIDAYGKKVPLKPDMRLKADVILNRISLMQWLLDPLLARKM